MKMSLARFWKYRLVQAAAGISCAWVLTWAAWEGAVRWVSPRAVPGMPRAAVFVEDREGREIAAFVGQEDAWYIPLKSEEISVNLKKAMIAAEDRRFFEHHGVDWRSVLGAAWQDAASFRIRRGASTISMQVVRLREPRARSFWAKFEQAFCAEQLELHETKDAILTEYLNRAPFGGNVVGAGAASWRYFGKSCRDLSLGQAALIAGLPQSPNRFRPDRSPELARQRRRHVLEQMLEMGSITRAEFETADGEPVEVAVQKLPQERGADGAMATLVRVAEESGGGRVKTTIDSGVQRTAYAAGIEGFEILRESGVDAGAIVVMDVKSAEILGSVSLNSPELDLTMAARSTGSVLKPLIYASAFEEGVLSPGTEVMDSPKAWAGYVPANFDKDFRGKMSAREALAESRNIPAMVVLSKLGVDRAVERMSDFGVETPGRSGRTYGLSLAIGGAEATPVEIATAYGTLARGGVEIPAHVVGGEVAKGRRVMPEGVCEETLACISEPGRTEAIENGREAAVRGVAWKTGTSNGFRDAWCAAVSREHVVVVWFGNVGGKGNAVLVGQDAAAPVALKLMAMLEKGDGRAEPWRKAGSVKQQVAVLATSQQLSIVTPGPNVEILSEAAKGPRVTLKCAGGAGSKRWWFAGDALIAATEGEAVTWSPGPGRYAVRVVDEAGAAAVVKVQVR